MEKISTFDGASNRHPDFNCGHGKIFIVTNFFGKRCSHDRNFVKQHVMTCIQCSASAGPATLRTLMERSYPDTRVLTAGFVFSTCALPHEQGILYTHLVIKEAR